MNLEKIYAKENRDPWKIRRWLKGYGYKEIFIDQAIGEYASMLVSGEQFGLNKEGVSILSNLIRNRVVQLSILAERKENNIKVPAVLPSLWEKIKRFANIKVW